MIVIAISFAVYGNALRNGFVYDDIPQVVQNPWIREIRFVPEIFSTNVWAFQGTSTNYYRPLMHMSFMLSYYLFGLTPWGFHLVNILLHAGVTVLVFLISSRLFWTANPPSFFVSRFLPFIAAVLFAVHPIHTEVVAWVGGVTDLSFSLFFLLALYLYILSTDRGAHQKGLYLLSVASFFLATLYKEPALTFPLILAAYDYTCSRDALRPFEYLKRYSGYLGAATVYFILRVNALGRFAPVRRYGELSAYEYLINALSLFRQYLGKLLLPTHLNAYHVFLPISSILERNGLLSLAITMIFAGTILLAFKKSRPAFFALALVLVPLLPALYIPGAGENTFAERYLYLPSFGFVLLVALLAGRIVLRKPRWSVPLAAALALIAALYSFGTVQRNGVWKDDEHLWRDVVQHSPDSAVPHYNLACALNAQGRIDEAIGEYQAAIKIRPAVVAYTSLGAAYQSKGLINEAIEQYQLAVRLEPGDVDAHTFLAAAYGESGALDKAIEHYRIVVQLKPDSANAQYGLGRAYLEKGQPAEAIPYLESAVRLKSDESLFRSALNRALSMNTSGRRSGMTGSIRER
ncbi:MAG TPA: tetratricopeptide repeat protein [Nitrospirota bacterium]|nr:tetratricopeptide repeat protein [Nitrospirota bacterium]